jgi:hypothetical protein
MAQERHPEAFAKSGRDAFSLTTNAGAIEFIHAAGDPACAIVRVRVLDMADVPRADDFAKSVLAGNFFWGGTRGATLSIGADNALWLTERRPLDELTFAGGLEQCLDDFSTTVFDWRERSALYE